MSNAWTQDIPAGWLPIAIADQRRWSVVRWMQIPPSALLPPATVSNPFLAWTVDVLRAQTPHSMEFETEIEPLAAVVGRQPCVAPAGIIFHMSRCGSTLVLNALRTAENVIGLGEAQPITRAFELVASSSQRLVALGKALMESTVTLFANHGGVLRFPIIKCSVGSIGWLPPIRRVWPNVPCIVLIRDPAEVIISNLAGRPRWIREWNGKTWPTALGPLEDRAQRVVAEGPQIAVEELCARVVGKFCADAMRVIDDGCAVVDYRDLTFDVLRRIAVAFGLSLPAETEPSLLDALTRHSTRPGRTFEEDSPRKQSQVTPFIRESADRWVTGDYLRLKESGRRLPVLK